MPEEPNEAQRNVERGPSAEAADDEERDDVIGQGAEQRVTPGEFASVLGDIDDSLLDELHDDARYSSSVESSLRRDDLDFIQMTGLTAPAAQENEPEPAGEDYFDPAAPISFAESGVEDVDVAKDPFANGDDTLALHDTHEFVPERPPVRRAPRPSKVLSDLSAIVKELETTDDAEDAAEEPDAREAIAPEHEAALERAEIGEAIDDDAEDDAQWAVNEPLSGETAAAENTDWAARGALTAFSDEVESDDEVYAEARDDIETESSADTRADDPVDDIPSEPVYLDAEPDLLAAELPGALTLSEQDVLDFEPESAERPLAEAPVDEDAPAELEDIVRRLEGEIVARKTRTPEVAEFLRRVRSQDAARNDETSQPVPETIVAIHEEDLTDVAAPAKEIPEEPPSRGFFQPIRTPFGPPSIAENEPDDVVVGESLDDEDWAAAEESAEFDSSDLGPADRSRRNRRAAPAVRLLQAALLLMAVAGLAAATYFGRTYFAASALNDPDAAFSQAETMLKRSQSAEEFAAASTAFLRIHEDHPSHSKGAPSLFNAAHALYSTPEAPRGPAVEAYQRAIVLFEEFIAQYPEHEKVGRAHSLAARLLYETGEYQAAIDRISDPMQRERDPGGYLGSLRIRANAYDALGDVEAAAMDLHAAADHPDNYTPHKDHVALADMYRTRARTETNPTRRREYQQRVIQELQRAHNLHGLDRDERRAIMNQIQAETSLLAAALQSGGAIAPGESAIPVRADSLETWRPAGAAPDSENEETAQ